MAKVPSFTKILREKFPGDLPWINNLLQPINSFMNDVKQAFENRFTISENFDGEVKEVTVNGSYPVKMSWGRTQKPSIGIIGKVEMTDGSDVTLPAAISLVWKYNNASEIQIDDVIGLDDSSTKKYKLKLIFLVG